MKTYRYSHVTIAGTFDRLHIGHKALIDKAFSISTIVSVGITSDDFLGNKMGKNQILPYENRVVEITQYLDEKQLSSRAKLFVLTDIFGISKTDSTLSAIVVTNETRKNAVIINKYRKSNNLTALDIIEVPYVKGSDNKIIRSTRIRSGILTREGKKYINSFLHSSKFKLPDYLRQDLRKPFGIEFSGNEDDTTVAALKVREYINLHSPEKIIAVGDITALSLHQLGIIPDITIIDLKTQRNKYVKSIFVSKSTISLNNSPGSLTRNVISKIHSLIHDPKKNTSQTVLIKGEEDLLTLPAILFSPLGSIVIYGQYQHGMIVVEVTEEIKQQIEIILKQFSFD